ncbi:MAG: methyltransferase domain-containing protein [Candidatus Parcubacteria bacterium]|nr:methyltransferase domain-containing protein [Candidatus Parcubacteria bacterium]
MHKNTFQEETWQGEFGNQYIQRNPTSPEEAEKAYLKYYGVLRSDLNQEFLGELDRSINILEVGANIGIQLALLQKMGFKNLYGVEINRGAIEFSKAHLKDIDIIKASALDIPFKDNYFNLVFTSGVLIHIAPSDLKKSMEEIYRCANEYIWGFEPFAENYTEVVYRGNKNLHWKGNYPQMYLDAFKDLKLIKEKNIKYLENENINKMFLLKK